MNEILKNFINDTIDKGVYIIVDGVGYNTPTEEEKTYSYSVPIRKVTEEREANYV